MYATNEFQSTVSRVQNGGNERKFMANVNERLQQNAPGAYYVDSSCVDCDMCRGNAPQFFRRDDEIGYSIVYRQPVTREEIEQAEAALAGCPSESIGYDGAAAVNEAASSLRSD